MMQSIFCLITKSDVDEFRKLKEMDVTPFPLTQAAWAHAHDILDPTLPVFWDLQEGIDFSGLDGDFSHSWTAWQSCALELSNKFQSEEIPANAFKLALADMNKAYIWGRLREQRYVQAFMQAFKNFSDIYTGDIHCFEPKGECQLFLGPALTVGLEKTVKNNNTRLIVHKRDNKQECTAVSESLQHSVQETGKVDILFLAYAMSDLGAKIHALGKSNKIALILTTQCFSSNIYEIKKIVEEYPNLSFLQLTKTEGQNLFNTKEVLKFSKQILETSKITVSERPLFLDLIKNDVPRNLEILNQVAAIIRDRKIRELHVSSHTGPEVVACLHAVSGQDVIVNVFAHALWPLHVAYRFDPPKGAIHYFATQSSAQEFQRGSLGNNTLIRIKPPRDLGINLMSRHKLCFKSYRSHFLRKPKTVGILFTSGMSHIASDIAISEEISVLASHIKVGLFGGCNLIFRYRGDEDTAAALRAILIQAGAELQENDIQFESSSVRPVFEFIQESNMVIELGVATSASLQAISFFKPCIRLTSQPSNRQRFKDRRIPNLNMNGERDALSSLLSSKKLQRRLVKAQYKALRSDMNLREKSDCL